MNFHPAASIFPLMQGAEYDALVADVAEHGQLEPIWLYEGKILDGRNRWRACADLGLVPEMREWNGDDPQSFVVSLNLHRRHLTREQRDDLIRTLRRNGAGYQKIADAVGVGIGTVHRATRDVELFQMEKLPGADGKYRPAQYTPRDPVLSPSVPHVSHNSGNNEWYTPPEYVEAARAVMGEIDLDPASSAIANRIVGATRFYTFEDDGLRHEWHGRVWMNPPYATGLIDRFTAKLAWHVKRGDVTEACVLVNNATETGWFNALLEVAACACFIRGRVKFIDTEGNPSGAPLQGQALLYMGSNVDGFTEACGQFGTILYAR
jgi:phage N-6-adenine-methyltransferase